MSRPFKTVANAAYKKLSTPNRAIVTVPGPVKTNTDNPLLPFPVLCQHRSQVRAVMLDATDFGGKKRRRVRGGCVLRVGIVNDKQFIPTNLIHRNQIFNGLLKSLQ